MSRLIKRLKNKRLKKSYFIKTANKTKRANIAAPVYRGGVRL